MAFYEPVGSSDAIYISDFDAQHFLASMVSKRKDIVDSWWRLRQAEDAFASARTEENSLATAAAGEAFVEATKK